MGRLHRIHSNRLPLRQAVYTGLACQTWLAIHLGAARAALCSLTVPAHRQVSIIMCLYIVEGIEHNHSFCQRNVKILCATAFLRASKYAQDNISHYLASMIISPQIVVSNPPASQAPVSYQSSSHLHQPRLQSSSCPNASCPCRDNQPGYAHPGSPFSGTRSLLLPAIR